MSKPTTYLNIDTDHIKISIAPLKETPGVSNDDAIVLALHKDDVLIIECNFEGLIKIPIKQYVIVRKEN